jgi:hypothetical protein
MYTPRNLSLLISLLIIISLGGCHNNKIRIDNISTMKDSVCIKFVDATDDALFTSVISDSKLIPNIANRIILAAHERLNDNSIGFVNDYKIRSAVHCDNKKIYVMQIKIDSVEGDTVFNRSPFGPSTKPVVKIKYEYGLVNTDGRDFYRERRDDTDPNLSDLTIHIGDKIADSILLHNYNNR